MHVRSHPRLRTRVYPQTFSLHPKERRGTQPLPKWPFTSQCEIRESPPPPPSLPTSDWVQSSLTEKPFEIHTSLLLSLPGWCQPTQTHAGTLLFSKYPPLSKNNPNPLHTLATKPLSLKYHSVLSLWALGPSKASQDSASSSTSYLVGLSFLNFLFHPASLTHRSWFILS